MSETDNKVKTAQEAAIEVRKQLKTELEKIRSLTKKEYTPKETFDKLTDSIKQQITQYQDNLVKLSKAETGESLEKKEPKLNKTLHGLPSKTPTNTQVIHDALNKTVFGMIKREMEMVQPSHKHTDPKSPGAVLPNDKLPPEIKHDPAAHKVKGGKKLKKDAEKMEKGALNPNLPIVREQSASMRAALAPKGYSVSHPIEGVPKLTPTGLSNLMSGKGDRPDMATGPNGTSIGGNTSSMTPTVSANAPSPVLEPTVASPRKTVSMKSPLQKGPHLGGKDPVSQHMTGDAMSAAAKDAKNAQMPTQQQMKKPSIIPPNSPLNIMRQKTYAEHMPKGPFNKSETKSCEECQSVLPNGHDDRICKNCMMKNERT